jgi:hypothetical protein
MSLAPITKPFDLNRISRSQAVASPAQIIRAVMLGVFFALPFVWSVTGGPLGA